MIFSPPASRPLALTLPVKVGAFFMLTVTLVPVPSCSTFVAKLAVEVSVALPATIETVEPNALVFAALLSAFTLNPWAFSVCN